MGIIAVENEDGTTDLIGKQGSTWSLPITLKQSSGAAFNLTGYAVRGQIRKDFSSATVAATWTATVDSPATNGAITLLLPASTSAALQACRSSVSSATRESADKGGIYVYDVEIYTGTPEVVERILEGKLYVDPEVTKA